METKKVSMAIKEIIAEDVANSYFVYNTEGEVIDYSEIDKQKTLIYRVLEHYTDIEIPKITRKKNETDEDFLIRGYDNELAFIDQNSDIDLYTMLSHDYNLLLNAIEAKIEFKKKKIENETSLGKVITKLIQKFLDKAPDSNQMQEIFNNFKSLDLNKLDNIMELKKVLTHE